MKKKTLSLICILAAALLFGCLEANAQEQAPSEKFLAYSQLLSPEKLYLQTDREVYCSGDTIWFKAYLQNASQVSEFPSCNYIYVELIAGMVEKNVNKGVSEMQEYVRERVKIKKRDDRFMGYIRIPENLNTDVATIRGYSYWMLNSKPEYMFYKNIELRNPMKDDFVENMVKEEVRDTYKYTDVGVANPYEKVKKEKKDIDVQFLPESGRYLAGTPSIIAVKAVNQDGLGTPVSGDIFADDEKIGSFATNELGMGKFVLTAPLDVKKMYAFVTNGDDFDSKEAFPLPSEQAVVINLQPDLKSVRFIINQSGVIFQDSAFVVVHDNTELYLQMPLTEKTTALKVGYDMLSEGINNIAVIDKAGNVYAQRSFFVYPQSLDSKITVNKAEYGPRDHVKATFDLKDENGMPVSGNFSVAVSDNGYAPYSGKGYNIVSYYYLGSEFESFVENSQSYFDENIPISTRISDIDLVMLTNGWKYYELPNILSGKSMMPQFGKEYTQSISGVVRGSFRTARKSIVSFLAPSIGFSAMGELDTTGYFALNGIDFPEGTHFLVGAVSMGGSTRRYTPYLDEDIFAKYCQYPKYLGKAGYSQEYKYASMMDYYNNGGEIVYSLNPSYISGTKTQKEENISPYPNHEFKPGQYRSLQELQPYLSYDLPTYIVTTCPPLRFMSLENEDVSMSEDSTDATSGSINVSGMTIACRVQRISSQMNISSGWGEIIVYVNGMRSSVGELEGMTVNDITGFAYLKGADAAKFNTGVDDQFSPRSVVLIKTKMMEHDMASNVSDGMPLGWQKPARIYTPKYETSASKKTKEQMRSTLYWNPSLTPTLEGGAAFDFYTSDHKSDATIVIEGLTDDGKPVFQKATLTR